MRNFKEQKYDGDDERGYDFRYSLSNPNHKQIIKDFEFELGDRSFEDFCYDKGYLVKNKNYPNGAVAYRENGVLEYEVAQRKMNALRSLRRLRFEAEKQEHLDSLVGEECLKKPDSPERCKYCYPKSLKEYYLAQHEGKINF